MTDLDLTQLTQDGDTLELPDGRTLRVRVEPDQDYNPFEDFDIYGRISDLRWGPDNRSLENVYGNLERPHDFDGNAEKIDIISGRIWWQPPKDGPKRGTPEFREWRSFIIDLASYGGVGVILELLDEVPDAYGQPVVRHTASLWGIDSLDDGYITEVVRDLAHELGLHKPTQSQPNLAQLNTVFLDDIGRWENEGGLVV